MSSPPTRTPGQLKVPELKEELRKRGITPKGLKKDLVEKLEEVLRKEGQEQFGNKFSSDSPPSVQLSYSSPSPVHIGYNSPPSVPVGYNSPLPVAESRSQGYKLPPSVADSRSPGYNPSSQVADQESLNRNSPLQTADFKSASHIAPERIVDHRTPGDLGRKNAEEHESDWKSGATNAQDVSPLLTLSSSEPAKTEHNHQEGEHVHQFNLGTGCSFGIAHGSENCYYDSKEGAVHAGGPAMESCYERKIACKDTVHKTHWSGIDDGEAEALAFSGGNQNYSLGHLRTEAPPGNAFYKDEKAKLSNVGPSFVEKQNIIRSISEDPMELEDVHTQHDSSSTLFHRFESEAGCDQAEAGNVTQNRVDCSHPERMSDKSMEERDKANSLASFNNEESKLSETGPHLAEKTNIKMVSVSEESMEYEDVQKQYISTNVNFHKFQSESSANCEESGAACLKENILGYDRAMATSEWESVDRENSQDEVFKSSETDVSFVQERKLSVSKEHMEPGYVHNQFSSLNLTSLDFESEPRANLEELEAAHIKENTEEYNHLTGTSGHESDEVKGKSNALVFQSGKVSKSSETELKSDEKLQNQYDSSCPTSPMHKSEHIVEESEAELKKTGVEYNHPMGTNESNPEEQGGKGHGVSDELSMSFEPDLNLGEKQKCSVMPVEEQREAEDIQNHYISLNHTFHEFESEPEGKSEETVTEDLKQNREEYNNSMGTGEQETGEQEGKGNALALHSKELPKSCPSDPSMAENSQIISALEGSLEPEDMQSQYTVANSSPHGFESDLRVNSEAVRFEQKREEYDHPIKMRKQEHEDQEDKGKASKWEGGSCALDSLIEGREKSEFPKLQPGMDSLTETMGNDRRIGEVGPMDVDHEAQVEKKRKGGSNDTDNELRQQEPVKRQRRWNSGKNLVLETSNTKPLTTDTLKDIIPQKAAEASSGASSLYPVASSPATSASPTLLKAEKISFSRPAPPPLKVDSTANGERKKLRIVPPPLRSPTTSLKIERFLRPFTLKALKELLSETGSIRYFWIDQIKTHCYVTYSSVEEATATRNALYNLKWPITGGRLLVAEFADPEEVKLRCEEKSVNLTITPNSIPQTTHSTKDSSPLALQGPSAQVTPHARPPQLPASKDKLTLASMKEPEPEPAIYTLDDLFKKTRAKPHIYYLPLTEEQVAAKLSARKKNQHTQTAR
eukprot:Gb_05925 [translate_table: standard]